MATLDDGYLAVPVDVSVLTGYRLFETSNGPGVPDDSVQSGFLISRGQRQLLPVHLPVPMHKSWRWVTTCPTSTLSPLVGRLG